MSKNLVDIYEQELEFLLNLKSSIGKLNNRIHDVLAAMAIEKLKERHPELDFRYANAGASGIDIEAYDASGSKKLIAEVKTTTPGARGQLRGPQEKTLKNDLERLKAGDAKYKYLILLSGAVKDAIQRRAEAEKKYPDIEIFNALE